MYDHFAHHHPMSSIGQLLLGGKQFCSGSSACFVLYFDPPSTSKIKSTRIKSLHNPELSCCRRQSIRKMWYAAASIAFMFNHVIHHALSVFGTWAEKFGTFRGYRSISMLCMWYFRLPFVVHRCQQRRPQRLRSGFDCRSLRRRKRRDDSIGRAILAEEWPPYVSSTHYLTSLLTPLHHWKLIQNQIHCKIDV